VQRLMTTTPRRTSL